MSHYNRLATEYEEVKSASLHFKFSGQGQRETPVAGRNGMLRNVQVLKGKKAAKFRHNMASLLEKYLADDITDRALQAHMADLEAAPNYYGLFNGGVNTAVTGMPTKVYRGTQVNLRPREAAREAFTDSMLGMTSTIRSLVRDKLAEGSNADEQLEFMQDKCAQAAELLGLHKKARQVQPRGYIAGNKRAMSIDLTARKQQKLLQTEQPRDIECAA